jgi:NAD-dependent deacetylase
MTELDQAATAIAGARSIAVLTGAGVSAESGIPTFRGSGGLWRGFDPTKLATPSAFAADPKLVWEFYNWRRALVAHAEPNPAHLALAEMARRVTKLTLITQNIDRLHHRAGSAPVIELHGTLWEVRCTACKRTHDRTGVTLPDLPHCDSCGALVRPAVVWFGEALPVAALQAATEAVQESDLLLVVGTSAVVYPAAALVDHACRPGRTVIEVNLEPTPMSDHVDIRLHGPAGSILPQLVPAQRS